MKLFFSSIFLSLFLFSCSNKALTPSQFAQKACDCIKLSKDRSESGMKAFQDCNTENTELLSQHRTDTAWMSNYRKELTSILRECMSE